MIDVARAICQLCNIDDLFIYLFIYLVYLSLQNIKYLSYYQSLSHPLKALYQHYFTVRKEWDAIILQQAIQTAEIAPEYESEAELEAELKSLEFDEWPTACISMVISLCSFFCLQLVFNFVLLMS